jgi:hypothetical protein
MATRDDDKYSDEKLEYVDQVEQKAVEVSSGTKGYEPTEDEKKLDKAINLKLDLVILPICVRLS